MRTEITPATATPGTTPRAGAAVSKFKSIARKFIVPAAGKVFGPRSAFDLEANSLHDATKVHCIVIADLDSDQVDQYGPDQIPAALEHLARACYLTGHNICNYDLPLLHRLYNWAPDCRVIDTMVAGRLILPNLDDLDDTAAAMGDPKMGKLRGRVSIEAWGERLGIAKAGTDIKDWSQWTPEMQQRCVTDTLICKALYQFLQPDGYSQAALELEHRVARICERITADGVPFNVEAAEQRRRQWVARHAELGVQLSRQFPDTNLNSRKQLGNLLEARGWIPDERTPKTQQPKITDEVLEAIPAMFPEFAGLAEYDILRRRLAQLSYGKEAWCKHVDADGRIHGGLIHIGTPHSRAKHQAPNIAQVPNPKRGKPFATECRALFRTSDNWVFVCADQAGLQDRAFAHYLAEFDGGAYAQAYLAGLDPHWKTATDLGLIASGTALDKQNRVHAAIREHSKGFRYGFLFGMGSAQAGRIINNTVRAVHQIDNNNDLQKRFFGEPARPNEATLKRIGKQALDKFIAGTPGLGRLRTKLTSHVAHCGWLPGLDRRVPTRAQYTALNYQVTSAEAVITKRWLVRVYDELNQKFRYSWNGDCVIVLWIHDEIAVCCRPEIADEIGAVMVKHAKEPGEFYGFKVPLDADYKIGRSWAGEETKENNKPAAPNAIPADLSIPGFLQRAGYRPPPPIVTAANPPDEPNNEPNEESAPIASDELAAAVMNMKVSIAAGIRLAAAAESTHSDAGGDANAGNGRDQGQRSDNYPHGERRGGRCLATHLYRDYLKGNHTKVEKWRSPRAKRAQYPQSFWVQGRWVSEKPDGWLHVPYRLPEMIAALVKDSSTDVFAPEGEKDCETLAAIGLVATTNAEGATPLRAKIGKWTPELSRWFCGVRRLFILADNDDVGRAFAQEKARALEHIVPDIRVVLFPDVPEGEDVSYWLHELGHSKEELLARCETAERWQGSGYVLVRASDIIPRKMDWLWPGHILRGSQELLTGIPGNGKSQIHCAFVAYVTTGGTWPDGCNSAPAGNVIMLTAEDCLDQTIVPRLIAAGADRDRVFVLKKIKKDNKERMFLLNEDLEELGRMIAQVGDVRLITIDPITAYIGSGSKFDSHRATDVRGQLGPLADLAERMDVALSAITHPPKHATQRSIDHFIGSQAYIAAARIGHLAIEEVDDDKVPTGRALFANVKNNVSRKMSTLAYRIIEKPLPGDLITASIVWEEIVDISADQAVAAAAPARNERGNQDDIIIFLFNTLLNGPVRIKFIEEQAATYNFSKDQLDRVKKKIGIVAFREKGKLNGGWFWALTQHAPNKE
jgi:DNA polymerase I-like protein with 3'-5' exonuclease and polymerase domains